MVPDTVPGDNVTARIIASKDKYAIAELIEINEPSPQRRRPPCPYVGTCGGCPWQQIEYAAQLAAKQQSVESALRRIAKLEDFEVLSIIGSPREFNYRRRVRLRCDEKRILGFSRPASHDLVAIDACEIAAAPINRGLNFARRWITEIATKATEIEIVTGDEETELVLVVFAAGEFIVSDAIIWSKSLDQDAGVSGVVVRGNGWRHVWGASRISVHTEPGIRFAVEADVFTQINPEGNRIILQHLLKSGEFNRGDRVLELYCGAGNFTLSVAKRANELVAIDGHRAAVNDGRLNAQLNGIENIRWRAAPVPSAVSNLARRREKFNKIVLDPPRAGAKGIDADLAALRAESIFYISCDPATLARDLAALAKRGYRLRTVRPFDLFPHSFHVESLAVLDRR